MTVLTKLFRTRALTIDADTRNYLDKKIDKILARELRISHSRMKNKRYIKKSA